MALDIILTLVLAVLFVFSHILAAVFVEPDGLDFAPGNETREGRRQAAILFALWAVEAALFWFIAFA